MMDRSITVKEVAITVMDESITVKEAAITVMGWSINAEGVGHRRGCEKPKV